LYPRSATTGFNEGATYGGPLSLLRADTKVEGRERLASNKRGGVPDVTVPGALEVTEEREFEGVLSPFQPVMIGALQGVPRRWLPALRAI
jgi:hypothetical protein